MNTKPLYAAIWISVSSLIQATADKISLADQEQQCRQWCERNGYVVTDVMRVDGYSRSETNVVKALAEFRREGVTAYDQLERHWETRDISMLVCYHDSRLGRSASLYTHALENTIAAGIDIYRILGGMVTKKDQRMQNALGIISATTDLDRLVLGREMGLTKNASMGRKTGTKPPRFFMEVLDDRRKPLYITPDRVKYQRLFDDFYTVFVTQRIPYDWIGEELFKQFGHLDENTGKPYTKFVWYAMLYSAATWGHSVYGRRRLQHRHAHRWEWWITGDEPAPDGIHFFRDTVEPIWQPPLLDRIKSEFHFRHFAMRGTMSPRTRYLFSGLLRCAVCGRSFSGSYYINKDGGETYTYRCTGRHGHKISANHCENKRLMPQDEIIEFLIPRLDRLRVGVEDFAPLTTTAVLTNEARIATLTSEIDQLTTDINKWITDIARQHHEAARIYQQRIDAAAAQIEINRNQIAELLSTESDTARQQVARQQAVDELRGFASARDLFTKPTWEVNGFLHRLMGDWKMMIDDRQVVEWIQIKD